MSQDLKIQVLGNGSLSTVRICIEKVSGKRFALKARGVLLHLKSGHFGRCILDILVQFLPFGGIEGKERHWLHVGQRWELERGF